MTIINIASKKSIYIIPGSKSYTLMPEIYTPVDMDMLDSAGLYSVQRDLDVLIVSDNNTALRQYLSKKTIQGAVSAESIQDLMAATLTNSVYDDEANTILVGGSGGNGGFVYGGDWDATSTAAIAIAGFNVLQNATASSNQLTVTSGVAFGATATNLSHNSNTGTLRVFRITVPDTSGGGLFFVGIHNSREENVFSTTSDTTATVRGVIIDGGYVFSFIRNTDNASSTPLPYTVDAGDVLKVGYRSDTSAVYIYNETKSNMQLIGGSSIEGFADGSESLTVFCSDAGSSLSFDFADDYPIYQSVFNLDYPEDLTKTYRVSAADANSAINSKLLKAADFVDFITNEDDEVVDVVVSRLVSDGNIRDTISATLNDPTSSVYTQTQSLGGTAGLDSVVSALYAATSDDTSDLTTSLDNFLAYLLANNASLFYEALRIYVQNAVYAYIEYNGDIYNAIAQYVSDSTTGVAGHSTIQTAIENSIQNYADGIGVGANGQIHLTVQEAAQSVISNEIQSGGIIDTAIQAVINL